MHLNENHINYLLPLIGTWNTDVFGKLTWNHVHERFKKKYGEAPNIRTLQNATLVKDKFRKVQKDLREGSVTISRKPSSLNSAAEKIQKLEARIKDLEEENQRIFHRLIVWQKNSMDHGMTKAQLEKPLNITKDTLHNLRSED